MSTWKMVSLSRLLSHVVQEHNCGISLSSKPGRDLHCNVPLVTSRGGFSLVGNWKTYQPANKICMEQLQNHSENCRQEPSEK